MNDIIARTMKTVISSMKTQKDILDFYYCISRPIKGFNPNYINLVASPVNNMGENRLLTKKKHKFGLLLQGPVVQSNDFTNNTIQLYQSIFPEALIVLSTWEDQNVQGINSDKIVILKNKYPPIQSYKNFNKMVYSINLGLRYFEEIGIEYILRTRTDQRIQEENAIEFFFELLKLFPLKDTIKNQRSRLITLNLYTLKYVPYSISDMFQFGHISDLKDYWNVDTSQLKVSHKTGMFYVDEKENCSPEILLATRYAKSKLNKKYNYTLESYYQFIAERFIVLDYLSISLLWEKLVLMPLSEGGYDTEDKVKLMFKDWLLLNNSMIDYTQLNYVD